MATGLGWRYSWGTLVARRDRMKYEIWQGTEPPIFYAEISEVGGGDSASREFERFDSAVDWCENAALTVLRGVQKKQA